MFAWFFRRKCTEELRPSKTNRHRSFDNGYELLAHELYLFKIKRQGESYAGRKDHLEQASKRRQNYFRQSATVFFFQAEDGIRDTSVTGVQTCALPISLRDGPGGQGLSRRAILEQVDGSLARLGTDYIDLYQIHRFDPDTPVEETMEALHDLEIGRASCRERV